MNLCSLDRSADRKGWGRMTDMVKQQDNLNLQEVRSKRGIRRTPAAGLFLMIVLLVLLMTGLCQSAYGAQTESGYAQSPWRSSSCMSEGKQYNSKDSSAKAYTKSYLNKQGKKYYSALLKKGKKSTGSVKVKLLNKSTFKVSRSSFYSGKCWYHKKVKAADKVCFQAISSVLSENPELYWIESYDWSYIYYYKKSGKKISIKLIKVIFKPKAYYSGAKNDLKAVQKVVKSVAASIKKNRPDSSRITTTRLIYEYLASVADYGEGSGTVYSPAGILLSKYGHIGVCNGYSLAFKMICDACGIPCRYVGSEYYRHAWNIVQMSDNKWYGIDVTWGDQGELSDISYRWFLYGQNEVNSGAHPGREIHSYTDASGETKVEFSVPKLAATGIVYG